MILKRVRTVNFQNIVNFFIHKIKCNFHISNYFNINFRILPSLHPKHPDYKLGRMFHLRTDGLTIQLNYQLRNAKCNLLIPD